MPKTLLKKFNLEYQKLRDLHQNQIQQPWNKYYLCESFNILGHIWCIWDGFRDDAPHTFSVTPFLPSDLTLSCEPKISLFLFMTNTWKFRRRVTCAASNNFRLQLTHAQVNCPQAPDWHQLFFFFPASLLFYLPPPLCSHMRLMWRDSNILQKSLALRWLRGSLITRFLTFSYSFNNLPLLSSLFDSLLLYMLTTWPSRSFDLWPRSRRSRPPCQMMFLKKLTEVHRASLAKQELLVWQAKQLNYNTSQVQLKSCYCTKGISHF